MNIEETHSAVAPAAPTGPAPSLQLLLRRLEHQLEQDLALPPAPEPAPELTPERTRVLAALAEEPGQTMTRLATTAVLPPASLTRHVDRLVVDGLVLRKTHPDDRRRIVVALSARGLAVAERLRAREAEVTARLRAALGTERLDALLADLQLLPFALD